MLKIFHELGDVIEIRIMEGNGTTAGYFKDFDKAIEQTMKYNGKHNVYFVLNKVMEPCYHRCPDVMQQKIKKTTTDNDIDRRRWILLDYDPKRPADISSTDEEKAESYNRMKEASKFLKEQGFPLPVVADSGNGWHNLYKIDLPNNQESTELVKNFLQAMDMLFSDDKVQVDTAVFNAARITKLYGTMAVKGANTSERPHRESKLIYAENIQEVPKELIQKIADMLPKPESRQNMQRDGEFDLDDWIRKNLNIRKVASWNSNTKYVLGECPFDSAHGKDSAIIKLSSGAISFHCFHNGCVDKTWQDLRQKFEPGCYDKKEYQCKDSNKVQVGNSPSVQQDWMNIEGIRDLDEKPYRGISSIPGKYIPTGMVTIDNAINDMAPGCVTLIGGRSNSGKTTYVRQIVVNAICLDNKVFIISGEGDQESYINSIYRCAIGRDNKYYDLIKVNKRLQKEPKKYVLEALQRWHKGKLKLFDKHESRFKTTDELFGLIEHEAKNNKHNLIVIDNLMSVLSAKATEKNEAQADFMQRCCDLAKLYRTHIILVLHPNKEYRNGVTFEMEHIAGSSDLYNKADNIIAVIREYDEAKIAQGINGKVKVLKNRYFPELPECITQFDSDTGLLLEIKGVEVLDYVFNWTKFIDQSQVPGREWWEETDNEDEPF